MDYVSDPERCLIEMPFTFINWHQIELMQMLCIKTTLAASTAALNIPFTQEIAQTLALNILPNISTVLHAITRNFEFVRYFLGHFKSGPNQVLFSVPFIENIYGKTALHLSLE